VYSDAGAYNENIILKILKWLSDKAATLHQTVRESVPQDKHCGSFSDAQLLVTLLRALDLRVRLVMVLNPTPFKERKASGKEKSVKGSKEKTTVMSSQEKELSEEGMELAVESNKPQSKSSSSGKKVDNGGTSKNTTGTTGKKVHQSTGEGSSSSCTAQKGTRNRPHTTKQRIQRSTSRSSPYFKKQTRRRGTRTTSRNMEEEGDPDNLEQLTSKQTSGSDSEYVPENAKLKKRNLSAAFEGMEDHDDDDDDDDDFEQPKKKRRKSSSKLVGATPAKKLKQATDRKAKTEVQSKPLKSSSKTSTSRRKSKITTTSDSKDSDSSKAGEGGSKSQSVPLALEGEDSNLTAATNSDTNQSRGSSLESVEILKSEETACWAEVYLTVAGCDGGTGGGRSRGEAGEDSKERWTCVHLPSCSVDQPHLCEKHCTIPLNYVIAIENGELHDVVHKHVYLEVHVCDPI
jgi:hypothetical protein